MKSQKHQTKLISTTENCFLRKGFLVVDSMSYFCRYECVCVCLWIHYTQSTKADETIAIKCMNRIIIRNIVWLENQFLIHKMCVCMCVCMDMSIDIHTHCNVASLKCILNFSLLKIIYLFILCEAGFWLLTLSDASNTHIFTHNFLNINKMHTYHFIKIV